jgi:predicted dehydrogenase
METIGIGILGAGRMGDSHAWGYAQFEGAKVKAIADFDETRAKAFAEKNNTDWVTDYKQLLERKDIQAIDICLPHTLHHDAVIAAAAAGKHILCEKPVEVTISRMRSMLKTCQDNKVTFMPGHTHRFYPENILAKKLIAEGKIGTPIMVQDTITMLGMQEGCPRWMGNYEMAGGGILLNNGVHSIDRIRYWLGAELETVFARCGRYALDLEERVEDQGTLFITLDNGSFATSQVSWITPKPLGSCFARIQGTKGILDVPAWGEPLKFTGLYDKESEVIPVKSEYGIVTELKEFVAAIREEREPSVTINDGFMAVSGILAAYESSKTGKPVTPEKYNS